MDSIASTNAARVALIRALSVRPKGSRNAASKVKRADHLGIVTERMLALDPRDVGDDVLLAVLLVGATERAAPLDEARRLLGDVDGNLAQLVDEPRADLGLTRAGQARFIAAAELLRRVGLRRAADPSRPILKSSRDVVTLLRATVDANSSIESFAILALDVRSKPIGLRTLTRGTFNYAIVDPRQIARYLVSVAAKSVILVHNHPSGDITPSSEDLSVTRLVQQVLKSLGIEVLDHLIVSPTAYASMADRGEMK